MTVAAGERLRLLGIGNVRSLNLLRWGRRLATRGHEVHLLSDRDPLPAELGDDLTAHRLQHLGRATRVPLLRRLRLATAIRELAERLDVDLVHAHYLLSYGFWAAEAGRRPLVVSPWGTDALVHGQERGRGRRRAARALTAADLVIVNSQALGGASVELGADASRIRQVLWHVDLDGFGPERADPGLRRRLGWPDDALLVLSLRNFRPDTSLDVLVRAFGEVAREHPRARLVLAARSGPLRAEIEQLVMTLELASRVAFLRVSPDELPSLVASADLAVTLANSDSAPPSLLETMASGLPTVVAEAASIGEWVGQGEGAEIVPRQDVAATAVAIARLLGDEELRHDYGERNRRVVRERVDDPTAELERLYREVLAP